jgi:hypothetical protein
MGMTFFQEHLPEEKQKRHHQQLVWFSHLEKEYQVIDLGLKKIFQWKEDQPPKTWDWDNCAVNRAKVLEEGKVRLVIRSRTNRNSDYMGHIPVQLRYMLGIDVKQVSEPFIEDYQIADTSRKNLPLAARRKDHKRLVFKLDDRYWIWQWAKERVDIKSTEVYRLNQDIREFLETAKHQESFPPSPSPSPPPFPHTATPVHKDGSIKSNVSNIFNVSIEENLEDVVPIIYQPAVDSLKNFLREVHCAKIKNPDSSVDVQVSLLFNNEELRRHRLLDRFYAKIRFAIYGRIIDVETFNIHLLRHRDDKLSKVNNNDAKIIIDDDQENNNSKSNRYGNDYYIFEGIYSGQHGIEYDTVHLDMPPAPKRPIEYYFVDHYHPVVFVNTANHAMSEHDNNHDLWKWEYIPWVRKAPIILGIKSRKEIDLRFTPIIKRIIQKLTKLN